MHRKKLEETKGQKKKTEQKTDCDQKWIGRDQRVSYDMQLF